MEKSSILVKQAERQDPEIYRRENLAVMKGLELAYPNAFLKFEKSNGEYCLVSNVGVHIKQIIGEFGLVTLQIGEYMSVVSQKMFDLGPIIKNLFKGKEPLTNLEGVTIKPGYLDAQIKFFEEVMEEISNGPTWNDYDYPKDYSSYWSISRTRDSFQKNKKTLVSCSATKSNFNQLNVYQLSELRKELEFAEKKAGPFKRSSDILGVLINPTRKVLRRFHR